METDKIKALLGKQASLLINEGMYVGLGTGTTVHYFIQELGKRCRQGLKAITAVASSEASHSLAKTYGIPVLDEVPPFPTDITVDGADAINHNKSLIKGGGGALLREKILATNTKQFVVLLDESKLEKPFETTPLPVEIIPFASNLTLMSINALGLQGTLRQTKELTGPYLTDNGHYIYDVQLIPDKCDYEKLHSQLLHIPGVVETGFFPKAPSKILVGRRDLTTYEMV